MQNLHIHTTFSDGKFSPEEVIKTAVRAKLSFVGISDHYKTKKIKDETKYVSPEKLPEYLSALHELKQKYEKQIQVLAGLEIDGCILRTNFSDMPFEEISRCDYVLMEYIGDNDMTGMGMDEFLKIRPLFTCKTGLAHCDVEKHFGKEKYDGLLDALEANSIFMEMCPSKRNSRWGTTPYYLFAEDFFDRMKSRKIFVSIGTDMHDDLSDVGHIAHAVDFIRLGGLKNNLLYNNMTTLKQP